MEARRPLVMTGSTVERTPGPATPGMDRRLLIDHADRWVGWVQTEAGLAGGWHHHGDRDSYIWMARGGLRVEYGPGGREAVHAVAGDFVFNPARLVHREVTDPGEPAECFIVRIGPGPQVVNVEGPDADG